MPSDGDIARNGNARGWARNKEHRVLSHILVTGGAGFIGGNFVLNWLANPDADEVVNVDKLTYAATPKTLTSLEGDRRHVFWTKS